ncbi:MAG: indole-3-glycerol phosphate synthase TrpC [Acidobacteria bacterium]|nr:MAG: indole-3-glycerol phosphate synthase TrpC [Acidobacteriota bacterium]REK01552.1 MAG: indole-3-glycerol phosphate synthase TrpC [Acidobacteriota bacterium]REK14508.1 MAG: indole-3-glycerol phosphate synthase TrpC [Acidobacteriota bacterium]REK45223.1 MAG: indole-3-glycerol phosphate synthase TrpC [Acidobacteriota bacterium]
MSAPSILQKIFESKRLSVERTKSTIPTEDLMIQLNLVKLREAGVVRAKLSEAVSRMDRVNIIAEFKRASPSKGVINDSVSPVERAKEYERAGAAAVSVLTEEEHFDGCSEDLASVRNNVSIPILRKDFIFDPYQIYESKVLGASALLLIAAMLEDDKIAELLDLSRSFDLEVLIEVHNEKELERAISLGADLIGVNNRDLNTFEVSLDHSRRLIRHKPEGVLMISESGLSTPEQIVELRELGFDGFLIGEALMIGGENRIGRMIRMFSNYIDQ